MKVVGTVIAIGYLIVVAIPATAQNQPSCWDQWTKRNCSDTNPSMMTCKESKRIYEDCHANEVADRERMKREKEAAYRRQHQAEIDAMESANRKLGTLQKQNGNSH